MKLAALEPRHRRALAVGLMLAVILLMFLLVAAPIWYFHRHYDQALAAYGDQISRKERIVAAREATERKLAILRARQIERNFLKGSNPNLAAAELQDIFRTAIEPSGAKLTTVFNLPHKEDGRYRQIGLSVNMTATGPALRKVLHQLETGRPQILVDSITVRQSVGTNFRPTPGNEPEMFVQMEIVAFSKAGGS